MNEFMQIADDVLRALRSQRPVVALETTVVTHGLPHPQGLECASMLESEVRLHGATPATIGILEGRVHVGLTPAQLSRLATAEGVTKLNLSNLAAVLADGTPGSTTVAATMWAASQAGIAVFATGGIGGVHRGAAESGDVSADMTALAKFPVAVVCAGAKAILDLPRTVEMLETSGVPVYGFGTEEFPAFYRRSSGLRVDARFDSIEALAAAVSRHFALGTGTGVLVASPIPSADEMPESLYERALGEALAAAEREGVGGRAVTPFLLDRMRQGTGGESLKANVALLRNNARVAGLLAAAMSRAGH